MKKILGIYLVFAILLILPSLSVYGQDKEITEIEKLEISALEDAIEEANKEVKALEKTKQHYLDGRTIKNEYISSKEQYDKKKKNRETLETEYAGIISDIEECKKSISEYSNDPDSASSKELLKLANKRLKDLINLEEDYTKPVWLEGKKGKHLETARDDEAKALKKYDSWANAWKIVEAKIDEKKSDITDLESAIAERKGLSEDKTNTEAETEQVTEQVTEAGSEADTDADQDETELEQVEVAAAGEDNDENPVVPIAATTEAEDGYEGVKTDTTTSTTDEPEEAKVSNDSDNNDDASTGGGSYTVVRGDSLSAIARRQLGDASRWPEIVQLNKDKHPTLETNPDLIYSGWKLTMPKSESSQDSNASTQAATNNPDSVQEGNTSTTNSDFIKADKESVHVVTKTYNNSKNTLDAFEKAVNQFKNTSSSMGGIPQEAVDSARNSMIKAKTSAKDACDKLQNAYNECSAKNKDEKLELKENLRAAKAKYDSICAKIPSSTTTTSTTKPDSAKDATGDYISDKYGVPQADDGSSWVKDRYGVGSNSKEEDKAAVDNSSKTDSSTVDKEKSEVDYTHTGSYDKYK